MSMLGHLLELSRLPILYRKWSKQTITNLQIITG